jgi:hypothetical protein
VVDSVEMALAAAVVVVWAVELVVEVGIKTLPSGALSSKSPLFCSPISPSTDISMTCSTLFMRSKVILIGILNSSFYRNEALQN